MELAALKTRIKRQIGHQLSRTEEDIHDNYVDFFVEGLEWVMHIIEELECAEEKQGKLPPHTEALIEQTTEPD